MSKNILKEISNFSKTNNSYSDLNIVNNLIFNTKFTKSKNKNLQLGGTNIVSEPIHMIKEGTILYLVLNDKLNDISSINSKYFFTPNFRLAADKLSNYIDKNKGYIYTFTVKKDIPNIIIKSHDRTDNIDINTNINTVSNQEQELDKSYNGIGFIYPKNEIEAFALSAINSVETSNPIETYSQFIIYNPTLYLTMESNICRCESLIK